MSIQIITDHDEMYRQADELGLCDLLFESVSEIDALADQYPGSSQFVINKSIKGETAFVIVMVTSAGLFGDAVLTLDTEELSQPSSSTIDQIAARFARRMLEALRDHPPTCDKCGQPTNLN
jgi:hypothetical protein